MIYGCLFTYYRSAFIFLLHRSPFACIRNYRTHHASSELSRILHASGWLIWDRWLMQASRTVARRYACGSEIRLGKRGDLRLLKNKAFKEISRSLALPGISDKQTRQSEPDILIDPIKVLISTSQQKRMRTQPTTCQQTKKVNKTTDQLFYPTTSPRGTSRHRLKTR